MHAPEPWQVGEEHESMAQLWDANCKLIGNISNHFSIRLPEDSPSDGDDDVNRIVACVNFCRGITNDQLALAEARSAGFPHKEFPREGIAMRVYCLIGVLENKK